MDKDDKHGQIKNYEPMITHTITSSRAYDFKSVKIN